MNGNVGPYPGASQTVGGSTLPSSPTARQIFAKTSGGSEGLYVCLSDGSWVLLEAATSAVTGSGTSGQVTFWNGTSTVTGSANLTWTSPQLLVQGLTTTSPGFYSQVTGDSVPRVRIGLNASDVASLGLGSGAGTRDTFLERAGAANLRLGAPAVDTAPVAQTISVQNVLAGGTSNVAGANFTFAGSQGKGTGVGGSFIFQVAPAGSTGTTVNALENKFIVGPTGVTIGVGETTTGQNVLLLNPTTMASGSLIQASVNSVSKFSVSSLGAVDAASDLISAASVSIRTGVGSSTGIGLFSPSDGVLRITNWAASDFSRLQLGGTTSSFPSLKRSSTTLAVRLADDSADAPMTAAGGTFTGEIQSVGGTVQAFMVGVAATAGYLGTRSNHPLILRTNNTDYFSIGITGAVFLNTANYNNCAALTTTAAQIGCTVSDERMKDDIVPFKESALTIVGNIDPIVYSFKPDSIYADARRHLGLSAQNLMAANSFLASSTGNEEDLLQPEQLALHALEILAIKELDDKLSILDARINAMREMLAWQG